MCLSAQREMLTVTTRPVKFSSNNTIYITYCVLTTLQEPSQANNMRERLLGSGNTAFLGASPPPAVRSWRTTDA